MTTLLALAVAACGTDADQQPPAPLVSAAYLETARADSANWLMWSGSYDGQRYSLLSELDQETVGSLRRIWHFPIETGQPVETTPLVVNGIMYLTRPPNDVVALDAATGQVAWQFRWPVPDGLNLCCGFVNRGVAIRDSTLFLATLDAQLVAIHAATGQLRWSISVADWRDGFNITAAPLIVKDLVLTGTALSQAHLGEPTPGVVPVLRGRIDAYDAGTGALRWRFYTIPVLEEAFSNTWEGESWWIGGGATWLTGTFDPELNLVYWGVGAPNRPAMERFRPGDNLYTSAVVALDADSGTLRWHFQFTPHDSHDWDAAHSMVLADLSFGGETQAMLLNANRNGFYYVLDRSNGRFVTGRAFARQTWALGLDRDGKPIVGRSIVPSVAGNEVAPSQDGATSWWPPAFSPRTSLFYVTAHDASEVFYTVDLPAVADSAALERIQRALVRRFDPGTVVSTVRALDASTGRLRWEHRLPGRSTTGLLATAGGLVFAGSTEGDMWALNDATGQVHWHNRVDGWIHSGPVTYRAAGQQMMAVASSKGIYAFARVPTTMSR